MLVIAGFTIEIGILAVSAKHLKGLFNVVFVIMFRHPAWVVCGVSGSLFFFFYLFNYIFKPFFFLLIAVRTSSIISDGNYSFFQILNVNFILAIFDMSIYIVSFFFNDRYRFNVGFGRLLLAVIVKPLKYLTFVKCVKLPITARCYRRWC